MTKTILAEAVTRGSAVQKMTVASCECLDSKMLPAGPMERYIAGLASTSKSLAQMNKSPDVDDPTKEAVKSGNSA